MAHQTINISLQVKPKSFFEIKYFLQVMSCITLITLKHSWGYKDLLFQFCNWIFIFPLPEGDIKFLYLLKRPKFFQSSPGISTFVFKKCSLSFRALQGAKEAGQIVNNINPPVTECWHPANKWLKYNYRSEPVGLHYAQDKIQLENKIYILMKERLNCVHGLQYFF